MWLGCLLEDDGGDLLDGPQAQPLGGADPQDTLLVCVGWGGVL